MKEIEHSFEKYNGTWFRPAIYDPSINHLKYEIHLDESSTNVQLVDLSDGEEAVITEIQFGETGLSFTSLFMSTGRLGHYILQLGGENSEYLDTQFTFQGSDVLHRVSGPVEPKNNFLGTWRSKVPADGDDMNVEYQIRQEHGEVLLSAVDYNDHEQLQVEDLEVQGEKLSFTATMQSTGRITDCKFSLTDEHTIEAELHITDFNRLHR